MPLAVLAYERGRRGGSARALVAAGLGGLLVVVVLALVFGINPLSLLGGGGGVQELD
jgi:predicted metalloprotease